jgi:hypothetical protein
MLMGSSISLNLCKFRKYYYLLKFNNLDLYRQFKFIVIKILNLT